MGYDKDPTLITLRLVLRAEEIIETGWLLHVRLENDELSPRNATIIVVKCPFTTKDAERLRWYLEDYPTVDPLDTARADTASRSVADYGRALSKSLFVDEVLRWFESVVQPVALQIVIEASTQATTIFSLHWEILEDTSLWLSSHPSSFQQKLLRVGVWRKLKTPGAHCTTIHFPITNDAPAFRILLVVARSNVFTDIGHRTISRPLIEIIETISSSDQSVMVEIVRPGTWEALENCLQIHPPGYYHVVHFDMHGRAYIMFQPSPVTSKATYDAWTVGQLLQKHGVSLVLLNSCETAKELVLSEASFARTLVSAGIAFVVAMSYQVTISAAVLFVQTFYHTYLVKKRSIFESVLAARQSLRSLPERTARFGLVVDLQDSFIPVVYHVDLPVSLQDYGHPGRADEIVSTRNPSWSDGFLGRDIDVLQIERCLLERRSENILLLHGMRGVGKTALVRHLNSWWLKTNFIKKGFYFDYEQHLYSKKDICSELAVLTASGKSDEIKRLISLFRSDRYLLVLDNLDRVGLNDRDSSCTGNLLRFLKSLKGARTFVILCSSRFEIWAEQAFRGNIYLLGGLPPFAAFQLVSCAIRKLPEGNKEVSASEGQLPINKTEMEDAENLLSYLSYAPQSLKAVMPFLHGKKQKEVFNALQFPENITLPTSFPKLSYQISSMFDPMFDRLDQDAKELLLCFAPFSRVLPLDIDDYFDALDDQNPYGSNWEYYLISGQIQRGVLHKDFLDEYKRCHYPTALNIEDEFSELSAGMYGLKAMKSLIAELSDSGFVQTESRQYSENVPYHIHPLLPAYVAIQLQDPSRKKALKLIKQAFVNYHFARASKGETTIAAIIKDSGQMKLDRNELNSVITAMSLTWDDISPDSASEFAQARRTLGGIREYEERFQQLQLSIFSSHRTGQRPKLPNIQLMEIFGKHRAGRVKMLSRYFLWAMFSGITTHAFEELAAIIATTLFSLSKSEFSNFAEFHWVAFCAVSFLIEMKRRRGEYHIRQWWCLVLIYMANIVDFVGRPPNASVLLILGLAVYALGDTEYAEILFEAIFANSVDSANDEFLLAGMYLLNIATLKQDTALFQKRFQMFHKGIEKMVVKNDSDTAIILGTIRRVRNFRGMSLPSLLDKPPISPSLLVAALKPFSFSLLLVDAVRASESGQMEQAYSLVHQALEAAVKEELVFCQIRCYDLLCNFALKEEKWQQAFTFAQNGQIQIEEHEDSIRMESSHGSRYLIQAYCSEKLGNRSEASQLYQKGLQLSLFDGIYVEAAEAIIRLLFESLDWDD